MTILPREYRILSALDSVKEDIPKPKAGREQKELWKDFDRFRGRVRSLPSMFLRHGVAQTLLFLTGKGMEQLQAADERRAASPSRRRSTDHVAVQIMLKLLKSVQAENSSSPIVAFATADDLTTRAWADLFGRLPSQDYTERYRERLLMVELAKWLDRYIEAIYQSEHPDNR